MYQQVVNDQEAYRAYLDDFIRRYPELFPRGIERGYKFCGFTDFSVKMPDVRIRRICLHERDEQGRLQVFQVVPSFVLPYMTGRVAEVEKPLFLHYKFGVPFWALSYVFGRDDSYWYRVSQQLGRPSLVGTSVKQADKLPEHLLADEKHTRILKNKAYVACTVAEECVLGASISLSASEEGLSEAYRDFKDEACELDPDYQPQTVNTDGWLATQAAWQTLFPGIVVMLCFLHAFLKIRDRAKRLASIFPDVAQKVWDAYHQDSADAFIHKVTVLQLWAEQHQEKLSRCALEAIHKLCRNAHSFSSAYEHPGCHRTSNMLDRHLDALDRYLYGLRYFHGHLASAQLSVRGWALAHNFMPYCPRAEPSKRFISPTHRLNGFVYRENWLENLFVSASLGGRKC
ncbi:MAG: hypothetical protein M3511_11900 [Deinococcota bacterium]|nr:hypothetical protein [Deinococcota bacterium]